MVDNNTDEARAAERTKIWRLNNKEYRSDAAKEMKRQRQREYYRNNTGKHRAYYKTRDKHMEEHAAPKWLTKEQWAQIESFYITARALTTETGVLHTVDHVWPIKGRNSCGLHVPWNLQILTQKENNAKGNKDPTVGSSR